MSKTKKIIITIIAVLLVLSLAAYFLVPRVLLAIGTRAILPDVGESAIYFTKYDILAEDVQTIDNGKIAIDIPADYVKREFEEGSEISMQIYHSADKSYTVLFGMPDDLSGLNLLDPENFDSTVSDLKFSIGMEQLKSGFEAIGNGLPDSAYNTFKCMALLDSEDNSFWNFNQATAFLVTGTLKTMLVGYAETEICENGDICALINYYSQENADDPVKAILEIYDKNDLNTVNTVLVAAPDRDGIYEVLNSARPVS